MISRMSELLAPEECQDFYQRIKGPEEDIEKLLAKLSPEKNVLRRERREIVNKEQCKVTLEKWLETQGDTVYWDRFAAVLYKVGRSDVAKELGKNLNQDKTLAIKKNVEGYQESMKKLHSSLLVHEEEMYGENVREERDLNNFEEKDWELIIEREQLPPYNRSLTGWCWPILYGVIYGFIGAAVLAALIAQFIVWITGLDNVDAELSIKLLDFSEEMEKSGTFSSDDDNDTEKTSELCSRK
ncbi:transmembrane and death domain protein 1 [Ascaphus truei]|uniref:transmembrane and death domain protein 1 n=1 Tax=Ascaphus truei TaxID=8439 RepID=UPI003F59B27F